MSNLKRLTPLILALLVAAIVSAIAGRPKELAAQQTEQAINDEFQKQFPIVDYAASETLSPEARAEREAKSAKYDDANFPIDPNIRKDDQIFSTFDWEAGLPALPVAKSNAIIVGRVKDAKAYLSNDKTAVYSEFTIQIDSVLWNNQQMPLPSGGSISAERDGGRVRFPSGKIALSLISGQGMPLPERSYVLFLTHDFPLHKYDKNAFHILTGYELRNGQVLPLDNPGGGTHPMATYKGADEETFMDDLCSAIHKASVKKISE